MWTTLCDLGGARICPGPLTKASMGLGGRVRAGGGEVSHTIWKEGRIWWGPSDEIYPAQRLRRRQMSLAWQHLPLPKISAFQATTGGRATSLCSASEQPKKAAPPPKVNPKWARGGGRYGGSGRDHLWELGGLARWRGRFNSSSFVHPTSPSSPRSPPLLSPPAPAPNPHPPYSSSSGSLSRGGSRLSSRGSPQEPHPAPTPPLVPFDMRILDVGESVESRR